jgi:hypothetical protein
MSRAAKTFLPLTPLLSVVSLVIFSFPAFNFGFGFCQYFLKTKTIMFNERTSGKQYVTRLVFE